MKRMVYLFYQCLLLFLFPCFLLFVIGRILFRPEYRDGMAERWGVYSPDFFVPLSHRPIFWIHAVSVGEVLSSRSFIKRLRVAYPAAAIVFSTGTPTGRKMVQEKLSEAVDRLIYLPFDYPWMTRAAVRSISPTAFIFMETEIWPNLLHSLSERAIPAILLNGRISDRSFGKYRCVRLALRPILNQIALMMMQTERDARKIMALGAPSDRVICSGNMKYDQATEQAPNVQWLHAHLDLKMGEEVMIAGSTHEGEEEFILDAYQRVVNAIGPRTLLIAPRHLTRLNAVETLLCERGCSVRRFSAAATCFSPSSDRPVILLDRLGALEQLYSVGDLIFVGGSLVPMGGHNPLEVAKYKRPVFFGPCMNNFLEIADALKRSGGGIEIATGRELGLKMIELISNPADYKKRGEAAYHVVVENGGAVERNVQAVVRLVGGGR